MATDLERLTVLIEANTRSYERSMLRMQQQTDKAIRGASRSIGGLDKSLAAASRSATTFAKAFGAGFLVGGLSQLPGAMRDMVKQVADLGDQADRIGITAERLQELNYQAEQTGVSAETMGEGLQKFAKNLAEARTGSGDLYKLLVANGVALEDLAKMDVNEALRVFVDLIGNAADEADALKIATVGMGKGGADAALSFKDGADGMKQFADEAHRSSQIISNELVKSAQEIDDEFAKLTGTISTMIKGGLLEFLATTQRELQAIGEMMAWIKGLVAPTEFARGGAGRRAGFGGLVEDRASRERGFFGAQLEPPTVLPPPAKSGGRAAASDAAAKAIEREKKAVVELIAELERERSLIGATDVERRISNELRDAGAVATQAQKDQITALVIAIDEEEKAQQRLIDTMDEIRSAGSSALDAFAQSIADAKGPLEALKAGLVDILQTIIRIAEQQAIAKLFGAAGTAGGGIFGSLASAALGAAPGIGSVAPARAAASQAVAVHVTATPSPLLNLHITKSSHQAEERAIARGPVVARDNNLRYAIP